MKKLLWIPAALLMFATVPSAEAKLCIDCEICQSNPDLPECNWDQQGVNSTEESLWQSMLNAFARLF